MATTADAALDRLWQRFRAADVGGPGRDAPGNADLDICYVWVERVAIMTSEGRLSLIDAEAAATLQVGIRPNAASIAALAASLRFPAFPAGTEMLK